jgi:hypothetical protein
MTIAGGDINASGADGAAIGSGYSHGGSSVVSYLTVLNGSFRLQASPPYSGIGAGPFSSPESLVILGGFFDCSALTSTFCFNSPSLTFEDGVTTAITNFLTVGPSSQSQIVAPRRSASNIYRRLREKA